MLWLTSSVFFVLPPRRLSLSLASLLFLFSLKRRTWAIHGDARVLTVRAIAFVSASFFYSLRQKRQKGSGDGRKEIDGDGFLFLCRRRRFAFFFSLSLLSSRLSSLPLQGQERTSKNTEREERKKSTTELLFRALFFNVEKKRKKSVWEGERKQR